MVPLIVGLELSVAPFVLLRVKLFNAVKPPGISIPVALPPIERFEEDVVESVPEPVGTEPLSVNVCAPTVNAPDVGV